MPDNATRAEKPTAHPAQLTEDLPAPEIESVVTRGSTVGKLRQVAIMVTHWPRESVAGLTAISRSERTHVERCQARTDDDPEQAPEACPDGGHVPDPARTASPTGDHPMTDADTATTQSPQWRLRYAVGEVIHYTEWTSDFAVVENLFEQYRRGEYGHDIAIERRTKVESDAV